MDRFCITIGRQYGSGGIEIAEKLSSILNIKYYDKQILELASQNSGYIKEVFDQIDEKRRINFSEGSIVHGNTGAGFYSINDTLTADALFIHKANAIKEIAERESCIIVGRCADYILKDKENVLKVFITCNDESIRRNRIKTRNPGMDDKQIDKFLKRMDRSRADYYSFYTDQEWGDAKSYDLIIDTGKFGIEKACNIIVSAVEMMKND